MQLNELSAAVEKAASNSASQKVFVDQLTEKFNAGVKTIRVFVEEMNTWSEVELEPFWNLQNDKWIKLSQYQGSLQGIQTSLQTALDQAIEGLTNPPAAKPAPVEDVK
ncbi:gp25 [Erwinia phage vB_EamM-Y2]|uniref:Gp25 n=1 Tax=Erwinia phage vB_EamM-Y2 TaxID=1051676 RepID=G0YPX4_9CAUD|nr:gp25 [Erwinia phage vB_EamM-Y2]AEJ81401.1 gp25 [Erwinia phage vB_EamM-Y2]